MRFLEREHEFTLSIDPCFSALDSDERSHDPSAIWLAPATRQVLDTMADMFVAYDRELNVVFANRAVLEASRASGKGALVGRNHWELWPESRGTVVEDSYAKALETGLPVHFEYLYPGTDTWVDVDAFPSGGYVHVYFRDVTARKKADADLRAMVDSLPQIAWASDASHTPTYLNRRWYEYTGSSPDEPYDGGRSVHPDDLPRVRERMMAAEAAGMPMEAEARLRRFDGKYRWHLVREEPRHSEGGNPIGYFGTSTDIHDLRVAREALEQSEARFRRVVEAGVVPMAFFDVEGSFTDCNDAFVSLLGYSKQEVLEGCARWTELTPPEWMPRTLQAVEELRLTGRILPYEKEYLRKDGSRFWGLFGGTRLSDNEGLAYIVDVTEARRAQEMLRSTADALPAFLAYMDQDLVYRFCNETYERAFARPREEIVGRTSREVLGPEASAQIEPLLRRVLAGETVNEARWLTFPGLGRRYMRVEYKPRLSHAGKVEGVYVLAVDETEQTLSSARLARSEERFRAAIGAIGVLWTNSAEGRMEGDQPGWAALTGQAREEYEGYGWASAVHPDDAQPTVDAWNAAVRTRRPFVFEHRVRGVDGQWRPYAVRAVPALDADGSVREWVGVHVDLTDLREAQEGLRESERRYRGLAEGMPVMVWTAQADGRVDFVNNRWRDYFRMDLEAARSGAWAACVHPDDNPRVQGAWRRCVATGERFAVDYRLRRWDGEYRWHQCLATPETTEGDITAWYGGIVDVHEQRAREETLALLVRVGEITVGLEDPAEIMRATVELVGCHLGVSRCSYAEVEEDGSTFEILDDYVDGVPKLVGRFRAKDYGQEVFERFRAGEAIVVNDVHTAPETAGSSAAYDQVQVRAVVALPLVRHGKLTALLGVHQSEPREWTREDLELLRVVADRCWSTIERARAERAFRESAAQYEQIAEGLPQMVWSAGPDGVRDYFNARWEEYTGVGLSESENPWLAVLHPEDKERALSLWHSSTESGQTFQAQYRLRGRDGRYRWYLGRAIPLRNDAGEVVRWFGTCTDVHDQRTAQEALEITNEFSTTLAQDLNLDRIVQALCDASTQAVGAQFGSFFYNAVNEQGEAYMLYTLSGAPIEAFERLGMPRPTHVFGPTFRNEGTVRSDDITKDPRYGQFAPHHGMPKGHLPVVSYLAVPVVSRTGEVIGGLFFGHPQAGVFTEEHESIVSSFAAQAAVAMDNARLYDRLAGMNQELETKVEERTSELLSAVERLQGFTYHVSHDLRAPLRAISSTSHVLREDFGGLLPEEAHDLLRRQADAATRLGQLVDDLLKTSRLSRQEMMRQPVDLTYLSRDAAAEALSTHPYSTVVVEVEQGLHADADPKLLRLAMLNLIENGVKYSPNGGTVRVGRREDGAYFVSDQGIGIEPRYFHKIFEPFQRLHLDSDIAGTGIGLANVAQVIERHGGEVWVESEFGEGSTFFFTLG